MSKGKWKRDPFDLEIDGILLPWKASQVVAELLFVLAMTALSSALAAGHALQTSCQLFQPNFFWPVVYNTLLLLLQFHLFASLG